MFHLIATLEITTIETLLITEVPPLIDMRIEISQEKDHTAEIDIRETIVIVVKNLDENRMIVIQETEEGRLIEGRHLTQLTEDRTRETGCLLSHVTKTFQTQLNLLQ